VDQGIEPGRVAARARAHRRRGARAGARHPGVPRQAVPDPEPVDGPDARDRPAGARQPHRRALLGPRGGRRHRLPPADGRGAQRSQVRGHAAPRAGLHEADRPEGRRELHQAGGGRPGRQDLPAGRARHPQRQAPARAVLGAVRRGRGMRLSRDRHRSRRALLHDGRQPWRFRRQPVLGTRPAQVDHRWRLRHLLAPEAHRAPL
ncbi:MAG: Signal peptidase I, partial [uncultured Solirubrobacterales bacterium]